jgi:hypothetical protein
MYREEAVSDKSIWHQVSEKADESITQYHQWVGQMLNLCVGSMTLLVALKSHLIPTEPRGLWLMQLCWILLACSIAAASVILHSKHVMVSDIAKGLASMAKGEMELAPVGVRPSRFSELCSKSFPWFLVGSLGCLALFAVLNTSNK